jgi:hypothetical protein
MSTALLQTTYFGPIQWYQKLCRYDQTLIEQYDSYQKQTYRNRCVIATANGLQALTVPVEHDTLNIKNEILKVKDLRISDHNNWRRIHWNALQSAYNESPFFDYYADDIRLFFEKKYDFLVDFNEAIRQTVCNLLDIHPQVSYTTDFSRQPSDIDDYREVINAKHPQPDEDFQPRRYWQVFEGKHGFQANLSILDLLFNMGNEAVFYL